VTQLVTAEALSSLGVRFSFVRRSAVRSWSHDVPGVGYPPSYYTLRVCPRADSPEWWAAVPNGVGAAPPGWDRDSFAPLWIYPSAPTDRG
jgi:hypothetical protein